LVHVHPIDNRAKAKLTSTSCGDTITGTSFESDDAEVLVLNFALTEPSEVTFDGCASSFEMEFHATAWSSTKSIQVSTTICENSKKGKSSTIFPEGIHHVTVRKTDSQSTGDYFISLSCGPKKAMAVKTEPKDVADLDPTSFASASCSQLLSGSTVGLPNNYGNTAGDVMYSFTTSTTQLVTFNGCGSSYDTYFWLLDSAYNLVTSNDDYCSLASFISTTLSAGSYYFVVDGFGSSTGTYSVQVTCGPLSITPTPSPSTSQIAVVACNQVLGGSTVGRPNNYGNAAGDVAYQFTSTSSQ